MPVDFLTAGRPRCYGRYAGEPSPAQLARNFHLDDADLALVAQRRGDQDRLGFALHLVTVRFLGTFLANPIDVPSGVVAHLGRRLRTADPTCLSRYLDRPATHREHAGEIRRRYGYRDFSDQPEGFRLVLRSHLQANPRNRYRFESRHHTKFTPRRVQQIVQEYRDRAGIECHVPPHLFRHQMLTYLTRAGLTDAQIQLISGHASKAALEVYQHLSLSQVSAAYQGAVRDLL